MRNLREYMWADSPIDALRKRASHPGRSAFLGGGTVLAARQDAQLEYVIDLSRAGLGSIAPRNDALVLGATATLQDLADDASVRGFASGLLELALRRTRTEPWRRQATLGGRIFEAEPTDLVTPCLLVLGARVVVQEKADVAPHAEDLSAILAAPARSRTAAGTGPLALAIELPRPEPGTGFALELVTRAALDAPLAAVAVALRISGGRIETAAVATSALPAPRRAPRVSEALRGRTLDAIAPVLAALADDIAPADDWRASAAYRSQVARVLLSRAIHRAASHILGG